MKATTQKEFIDRVTKIFPEYDFSKAIYKGWLTAIGSAKNTNMYSVSIWCIV